MAVRRHLLPVGVWIFLALVLSGAVAIGWIGLLVKTPWKGYTAPSVLVSIPPGASTGAILAALERGGVLRDARLGWIALRVLHRGKTLKSGEYRFAAPRSPEDVVLKIVAGDVVTYRVTVPEGYTAAEIFATFASQGFGKRSVYEDLFRAPAQFEGVPPGAPSLEGFLFPETYTVTRSMNAREILSALSREFARRLPKGYAEAAEKKGLTLVQAVTLASLVEKETSIPEERALVAAVYANRLRKGMLLQADPTTIYALARVGRWRGTLLRSDLGVDEPYNTYVRPGLPPGPVCNPGLPALRAALAPADVPYLFFVASGDGRHRFSVSYEEQVQNVALYRESRREARRAARAGAGGRKSLE